ncbi:MAG TPA: hypothetical protein VLZ55_10190 [Rhodanobacter sp.]|nr:hypothetical protein [Rhodanobacter sp.]
MGRLERAANPSSDALHYLHGEQAAGVAHARSTAAPVNTPRADEHPRSRVPPRLPKVFRAAADYPDNAPKRPLASPLDETATMKTLLVSAFLLLTPFAVQAECAQTDFTIKDFKTDVTGTGAAIRLNLSGELVNHCATASAAQVRIEAKDSHGNIIQAKQSWPAGTTNIAPGASTKFDLGRQFHFRPDMATYSATVVSVRAW